MIPEFIIVVTMLFIGMGIGYALRREDVTRVKTKIESIITKEDDLKPGIIRRPTAEQINRKHEPKSMRESKEAIVDALDQIEELQKAKEYIKKQKGA